MTTSMSGYALIPTHYESDHNENPFKRGGISYNQNKTSVVVPITTSIKGCT
jgi:hypothetical protein